MEMLNKTTRLFTDEELDVHNNLNKKINLLNNIDVKI